MEKWEIWRPPQRTLPPRRRAALCLRSGVDWGAADGKPVDLIFMTAMPPNAQSEHLLLLARLVTLLSDPEVTRGLRHAVSRERFIELLARAEAERFAE